MRCSSATKNPLRRDFARRSTWPSRATRGTSVQGRIGRRPPVRARITRTTVRLGAMEPARRGSRPADRLRHRSGDRRPAGRSPPRPARPALLTSRVISDGSFASGRAGWIEVVCGVMFSGKSEELIRRVHGARSLPRRESRSSSHTLDERYSGIYQVSSHDGRTVNAEPVDTTEQIARMVLPDTQVVAIDEAQFLDAGIVDLVTSSLANRGIRRDRRRHGHRFPGRAVRRDAAAALRRRGGGQSCTRSACVCMAIPASRNQRLIAGTPARYDSPTIMVGSTDSYEARCRACHSVPRRDEDQGRLL